MCFELKWRRLGNFPAAGLATIQEQKWRFTVTGNPHHSGMMRQWVDYFGRDATQSQCPTVGYSMPYQ